MKMSPDGQRVLKHYETCETEAYPDPASPLGKECTRRGLKMKQYRSVPSWSSLNGSPWTIGWGHTGNDVKPGMVWTQQQCDDALIRDLDRFEKGVSAVVKVPLNQGQFDALVDFSYNLGLGSLQSSTLLAKLNGGDYKSVGAELRRWNKAGGKVLYGLVKRCASRDAMFNGAPASTAIDIGEAQPRPN